MTDSEADDFTTPGLAARLRLRLREMVSPFRRPETQFPAVTLLVLAMFLIWGREALLADAARVFLRLGSVFSAASLVAALVVAFGWIIYRRLARGRRISLRLVARALFPRWLLRSASNGSDIGFFLLNNTVSGAFLAWALISHDAVIRWVQAALPAVFGAPGNSLDPLAGKVILTVAVFLAYEFAYWLDHYLAHKVPALWEFHRVHHTAETLTPLTGARVHPVSTVVFYNITAVTVGLVHGTVSYAMGLPDESFALGGSNLLVVVFIFATFHLQHSHVWISFTGIWGRLFASPAHHQIHHSRDPAHFGKNLGAGLALWDWLFGTLYIPSKTRERLVFGVAEAGEHPHSFTSSVLTPFKRGFAALAGMLQIPARRALSEPAVRGD